MRGNIQCFRPKPGDYWEQHWLPVVNVVRDSSTGAKRPETVHQLVPYLRLAYCESICIDLRWTRFVRHGHHNAAYGAFFGDLLVPNTFVDVLTVRVDEGGAILAPRRFPCNPNRDASACVSSTLRLGI